MHNKTNFHLIYQYAVSIIFFTCMCLYLCFRIKRHTWTSFIRTWKCTARSTALVRSTCRVTWGTTASSADATSSSSCARPRLRDVICFRLTRLLDLYNGIYNRLFWLSTLSFSSVCITQVRPVFLCSNHGWTTQLCLKLKYEGFTALAQLRSSLCDHTWRSTTREDVFSFTLLFLWSLSRIIFLRPPPFSSLWSPLSWCLSFM